MRHLDRWLLGVPIGAVIVVVATWLAPGRDGIPALLAILSPHVALAALGLTALLALARGRTLRLGLVALALVAFARFGGEWLSIAPTLPGSLSVATWNLEYGDVDGATTVAGLGELDVDVVALQELTPEQALAIEASSEVVERFPYRRLVPRLGVAGIGLLSRHPLVDPVSQTDPVSLQATIAPNIGSAPVTILTAHPYPGRIETVTPERIPIGFDPSDRDAALDVLRDRLESAVDRGGEVILLGDFNVAPTEAAFRDLAADMTDAHGEVGTGPGWTWRPSRFEQLPIGLLRIDYVLSSGDLIPVRSTVECPPVGDHCRVIARFASPG